jgi:hypothetical protein
VFSPTIAQNRRNNSASWIHWIANCPTPVNEQHSAVGHVDNGAVALSDVQKVDAKMSFGTIISQDQKLERDYESTVDAARQEPLRAMITQQHVCKSNRN